MTAADIRRAILATVIAALALPGAATAAELSPRTVHAWDAYVAATETRIGRELASDDGFLVQDFEPLAQKGRKELLAGAILVEEMETDDAGGGRLSVPGGMVHHWRGSFFLPGAQLDGLLRNLQFPSETGPHQEDVLALKVLERQPDALKLFIKMTRKKIVSVTYNTEHEVTYRRHGPGRASSRSVATKIAELESTASGAEVEKPEGQDRGFLWRMNSYWRYQQVAEGVIVELESLTLSRTVPLGLGVVVDPIIDRIARESMARTLENLRRTHTVSLRAAR